MAVVGNLTSIEGGQHSVYLTSRSDAFKETNRPFLRGQSSESFVISGVVIYSAAHTHNA